MRGIRRRRVMLAAIAALVVVASAVAYAVGYYLDPNPAPGGLSVWQRGDDLNVNGIILRVPAGWRVDRSDHADRCDEPDRTILVGRELAHPCARREAISVAYWNAESFDRADSAVLREMTLPSGQPAWILDGVGGIRSWQPPPTTVVFTAYLPWVSLRLDFSLSGQSVDTVLRSLRSERVRPARLRLARDVDAIRKGSGDVEAAAIKGALDLFAGLDRVVDTVDAPCADATFFGGWEWSDSSPMVLALSRDGRRVGALVYHLRNGCGFMTSSRGGRVWVPKDLQLMIYQALPTVRHLGPGPRGN